MSVSRADRNGLRTWVEIRRAALARNLRSFRRLLPKGCKIMAVAKSNAYGHGLYDVVPAWEALGVDALGVDSIVEAVSLRREGVRKPILVLGYTLPDRFADAVRHDVALTLSHFENLRALAAFPGASKIALHVKVDTGMHRQGFLPHQVPEVLRLLARLKSGPRVEGLYTHFAAAKDPERTGPTLLQIEAFERASAAFAAAGLRPMRHAAATAGALNYPQARYDCVRLGIGLLGLWPSPATGRAWQGRLDLEPALSWRTIVSEVKRLPSGAAIGYELTEVLDRDSVVGICPIGYWHGVPPRLAGTGEALVRGRRARILGRVSMDMLALDLTGIAGARVGDVATMIGRDGAECLTAREAADKAGITPYELLTRLNPLLRKFMT